VHIKSPEEVVSQIESIYIKEVTSWFFIIWDIVGHMNSINLV
jgi:hypothetical protein